MSMIERVITEIDKTLATLQEAYSFQNKRMRELRGKETMVLSSKKAHNGKVYYCARKRGGKKFNYIRQVSEKDINDIKEARYLERSLARIEKDIVLLEKARSKLQEVNYTDINASLPAVYRDPQLNYVSSNNEKALNWKKRMEAMIYNHFLALGITFVYEMPIKVNGYTYWADFVILSEIDYKTTVIIEHQGMMDNLNYRNRFLDKLYGYMRAGYKPGVNIFFTFDALDGGFDRSPIEDIIRTHIRPVSS